MARDIKINIVGDASGLKKALGEADTATSGFKTGVGKLAAAAGGALAVGEAFNFLGDAAKDAAADESEQKLFEQQVKLAGGSKLTVDALNKQIAAGQKLGFTDTELREALAQTYAQNHDLAKSHKDVALAQNLARAKGVDLNTALDAITKAQNGNLTSLSRMAPEYANLIKGAGSTSKAMDILSKAVDGNAETWASTSAGQMQIAKQQFGELKEQIGTALLPVLVKLTDFAVNTLIPALSKFVAWVEDNWPKVRDTIVGAVEDIRDKVQPIIDAMQAAWQQFGDNIVNFVKQKLDAIRDAFKGVFDVISGFFEFFSDLFHGRWSELGDDIAKIIRGFLGIWKAAFESVWADLKLAVGVAWDAIKGKVTGALDGIVGAITGMPAKIADASKGMFDGIKEAFRSAINWIIGGWNKLHFSLPSFDTHIPGVGKVGGFDLGVPQIPLLANGGTALSAGMALVGERGPELLNLPRGASVIPLGNQGGGGLTVHVNAGAIVHQSDLPSFIADQLRTYERRYGPLSLRGSA